MKLSKSEPRLNRAWRRAGRLLRRLRAAHSLTLAEYADAERLLGTFWPQQANDPTGIHRLRLMRYFDRRSSHYKTEPAVLEM